MDTITHIALGACMGEAFAGKTLGKKAMLWGAIAQSVPDIDFISSFWMDTASGLLAHRGFTHSFLFCAIVTPFFALLAERWHRPHNIRLKKWMLFFGCVIFVHIFLDAFNNYGVGWYEPFSSKRISFNMIFVADPFFSVGPAIAMFALIYFNRRHSVRKFWWIMGLSASSIYLLYCSFNKNNINKQVDEILAKQQIATTRYFTTPAPFQNWLWYIVAESDSGFYTGFRSVFEINKIINLQYFPRNDYLLEPVLKQEDLHKLIRFSQHYYTIEKWGDTLIFNDLRFGQIIGWQNPRARFAFYYYLQQPNNNTLVVQRGRFQGWNTNTFNILLKRIVKK